MEMGETFEELMKTVDDVGDWLQEKGFSSEIIDAFKDQEMDGEAISAAFASCPGPDSFKAVLPKLGQRLKVYNALKVFIEEVQPKRDVTPSPFSPFSPGSASGDSHTLQDHLELDTVSSKSSATPKFRHLIKEGSVPKPFPIPTFRVSTEKNFQKKLLTDCDRKYVVQTLATVLMTHVQRPSLSDCDIVAKALMEKFGFLNDVEGSGQHSWKWFIYNRCHNINRKSNAVDGEGGPRPKQPRLESKEMHIYPALPRCTDDDQSYKRNLQLLKEESSKGKPRSDVLKELMARTYPHRRGWILEDTRSVVDIITETPLLKKNIYATQEFGLIIDRPNVREHFDEDFMKWAVAVIKYSKETQVKNSAIQMVVSHYSEDTSAEMSAMFALRCLGILLLPTKTKRADGDIPFILKFVPASQDLVQESHAKAFKSFLQ